MACALASFALAGGEAVAQELPFLVADLNDGALMTAPFAQRQHVILGGSVLYAGTDGDGTAELFAADLATGATRALTDLVGSPSDTRVASMAVLGNRAFVALDDGVHGLELWSTDGTRAGTAMVRDLWPGSVGSVQVRPFGRFPFAARGGRLAFVADDGTGSDLWSTDGTSAGTVKLTSFAAGANGRIEEVVGFGNGFAIGVQRSIPGGELWVSDGTPAGTVQVASFSGPPIALAAMGNQLFFMANGGASGYEPWVSDGTAAGTRRLADIYPGSGSSYPGSFTASGNQVFFHAESPNEGRELWVTDGTPAGTRLVRDLEPNGDGMAANYLLPMTPFAGGVLVAARDPVAGRELWFSDGVSMRLVRDIAAGPADGLAVDALSSTGVDGGFAWFAADDGISGSELWVTDGTAQGTRPLGDLTPGTDGSRPTRMLARSGQCLAASTAGMVLATPTSATVLDPGYAWIQDQTVGSEARSLRAYGPGVFLAADAPGIGGEPWVVSAGAAPRLVGDLTPGSTGTWFGQEAMQAVVLDDVVLFEGAGPAGRRAAWVWRGAGAPRVLAQSPQLFTDAFGAVRVGDETWFCLGGQVWRWNRGLRPDFAIPGRLIALARLGDDLVALSGGVTTGPTLDVLVRSPSGTVTSTTFSGVNAAPEVAARPDLVLFAADDGITGNELWALRAGASRPQLVADIRPGGSSEPQGFTRVGDLFVFHADDGTSGREPWVTDGTRAGTRRLVELVPGPLGLNLLEIAAAGDSVIVAGRQPAAAELWGVDVPSGSAQLLLDFPGSAGFFATRFERLTSVGTRRVVFSGYDRESIGREAWMTDGTPAGTRLVQDLALSSDSDPRDFTVAGGTLYFAASGNGFSNTEVWGLRLGAVAQAVGEGCGRGLRRELRIDDPVLGATIAVEHAFAPPLGSGVLVLGPPLWPPVRQPQVGANCAIHVDPAVAWQLPFASDAAGRFATSFPVPGDPALLGVRFAVQAVSDRAQGGASGASNAVILSFGR